MSQRKLSRMKPEEIAAVIGHRNAEIDSAHDADAELARRREYAAQVKREFGYDQLEQALSVEKVEVPVDVVLLKSLTEMGITPLSRSSVERYRASAARNTVNLVMKGIGIPLLCVGTLAVIILVIMAFSNPDAAIASVSLWGTIFGIGAFLTWAEHALVPRREWRGVSLTPKAWPRTEHLIPREVLDLAFKVRERLPEAGFVIHELVKDYGSWTSWVPDDWGGRSIGDTDPFLEVRFGGEAYYIAVWDEPGFDGKLMEIV